MVEPAPALEQVRSIALAFPEAQERASHGLPSFFVSEKMFAQFRHDHHGDGRTIVAVRTADAEEAQMLIGAAPQTYSGVPYLPGAWVGVDLAGAEIDWTHIGDRIARSWELAAPRSLLEAGGR